MQASLNRREAETKVFIHLIAAASLNTNRGVDIMSRYGHNNHPLVQQLWQPCSVSTQGKPLKLRRLVADLRQLSDERPHYFLRVILVKVELPSTPLLMEYWNIPLSFKWIDYSDLLALLKLLLFF